MKNWTIKEWLSHVFVGIALLCVIIGGALVIIYKPSWSLDDATAIQTTVGCGHIKTPWSPYGYTPAEGRFFPLAYMHNNLVLLFDHRDSIPADSVYMLNAFFWAIFIGLLFWLGKCALHGRINNILSDWIVFALILIVAQRTIPLFTVLWSTIFIDYVLLVALCIALYYYFAKKSNIGYVCALAISTYFVFCIETNVAIPFSIAIMSLIGVHKTRDLKLVIGMVGVSILYLGLYVILILPNIVSAYDGAHGESVSIIANAVHMLLGQKLLILILLVFAIRLYLFFVKKQKYEPFSDMLLAVAVAVMCADFVMRLNFVSYYVIPIILAIPSLLRILSFNNISQKILSSSAVFVVLGYFVVKYPNFLNTYFADKYHLQTEMMELDNVLQAGNRLYWYMNKDNPAQEDVWAETHFCQYMTCINRDPQYTLPLAHRNIKDSTYLLAVPDSHEKDKILLELDLSEENIEWEQHAQCIKVYGIKTTK